MTPQRSRGHRLSARSRALAIQPLAARRLLAVVSEGAVAEISVTAPLDGLAGDVSGIWSWGDGTTTTADVSTTSPDGPINIRFDYSLDDADFFADPQRRRVLQAAGDSVAARLGDQLSAIRIDSPHLTWQPSVTHPSRGGSNPENTVQQTIGTNPRVNANEITVFVGSRPFAGRTIGLGGAGGDAFNFSFSASSQEEADRFQAAIDADIKELQTRGQTGADGDERTDISLSFGSIAFDRDASRYYFGDGDIQRNQIDFFAIAQHELLHVLGFGQRLAEVETSWDRLSSNTFAGPRATQIYRDAGGTGAVPLEEEVHWASSLRDDLGIRTILGEAITAGTRQSLGEIDFAALDDIGWEIQLPQITATGVHRYGDNGVFVPELVLTGSGGGGQSINAEMVSVTNVQPTTVATESSRTVPLNESFTAELLSFSDPGFGNADADPPTSESFTATVNWGDGTVVDVTPLVTVQGGPGLATEGTITATHQYTQPGTYSVITTIIDDDGAESFETTTLTVRSLTPFQNVDQPLDVDGDGDINPSDVLRIVNELRRRSLNDEDDRLDPSTSSPTETAFVDVDGDNLLRPIDALLVINELRRQQFEPEAVDVVLLDEIETREIQWPDDRSPLNIG